LLVCSDQLLIVVHVPVAASYTDPSPHDIEASFPCEQPCARDNAGMRVSTNAAVNVLIVIEALLAEYGQTVAKVENASMIFAQSG